MLAPETLQLGDTWAWSATVPDYPATTWTLKFLFHKLGLATPIEITAVASGSDYAVTVLASVTAGYAAGGYDWKAFVEKGSGASRERYTVGQGKVRLLADLQTAGSTTDNRTTAEVMLANVEDAIKQLSSKAVETLVVNGRTVTYKDLGRLLKDRSTLRAEVAREKAAAAIAQGEQSKRVVRVRFGGV